MSSALVSAQPIVRSLHSLDATTGYTTTPASYLNPLSFIHASDGNLYGTTQSFGAHSLGTIVKMTPAGVATVLHDFQGGATDGASPLAALVEAADGNFYGTTQAGGAVDWGTVFKMTPAGVVTVVHSFTGPDGAYPSAPLVQATDGNLYGTALYGGASNQGTAFRIALGGSFTLLHSFAGGSADGSVPQSGLLQTSDGNFLGMTSDTGQAVGRGLVYRMTPASAVTVLHAFTAGRLTASFLIPRSSRAATAISTGRLSRAQAAAHSSE